MRNDKTTEQQAVWGDQAGGAEGMRDDQAGRKGSSVDQAHRAGKLGATRPVGRCSWGQLASRGGSWG